MKQDELNTNETQAEQNPALTDLEPNSDVKGGFNDHQAGALRNLANTNTYQGTTTVNERESVKLSGLAAGTYL